MLATISDILRSYTDRDEITRRVSDALSLITLRTELVQLLQDNGVPTHHFESIAGWQMFGGQFFKAIRDKRLQFPPDPETNHRSSNIYKRMMDQADPARTAKSLRLVADLPGKKHKIHWAVELMGGGEIIGRLKNLEVPESFGVQSHHAGGIPHIQAPQPDAEN